MIDKNDGVYRHNIKQSEKIQAKKIFSETMKVLYIHC